MQEHQADTYSQIYKRGFEYGVIHFTSPHTGSIEEIIKNQIPNVEVKSLVELGAIYKNHKRIISAADNIVKQGDYIRVHSRPRRYKINFENIKKRILFENEDFIVVDKPSGLPVHATVDNSVENLLLALKQITGGNIKITHRLDIPTSGLIIYAKTDAFQKHFNLQLQNSLIKKYYYVKVLINNQAQHLKMNTPYIHYMKPSPRAPKELVTTYEPGFLKCQLTINEIKNEDSETLILKIELSTGRTHQIRSQLASLGYPILGDWLYGSLKELTPDSQIIALQSSGIEFLDLNQSRHSFKLSFNKPHLD